MPRFERGPEQPVMLSPTKKVREEEESRASHVEVTWSLPPITGIPPAARGGHTAVLADTHLLIFGGHYFGGDGTFVYLNDLYRLDLNTSTWHEIVFTEKDAVMPKPRYNHSALLMHGGTRMFVFGGRGAAAQVFRDMFFFDLSAMAWFHVQWTTDCPLARFGHSAASIDDARMVLFGGWDGKKSMNDLWIFDTNTFTWTKPKCAGKFPTSRHNHSMVAISRETLLVYGGYTVLMPDVPLPVYNKDVYLLDTTTLTWSRPRLVGEYPLGTFGQSVNVHDELAFVFGGWSGTERSPLYMGDKQVKELVAMDAREERLASGTHENDHGERNNRRRERTLHWKRASSYAHVLDVNRMQWFTPVSHGVAVANRYGHTCTLVGPHVFLFGGWDGNRALSQLVVGEFRI
uniref:Uncharacterized protein n=1 Tax=Globisporangium ultimum (strain ATCC 200006 / CBS 805.95 / DAOM BR144) TaxID=431595 RepID=K3WMT4_GLOUD